MYLTDILFLSAALIAAALQPKWKNAALLLLSLFFYACGSPEYVLLFGVGIGVNVNGLLHFADRPFLESGKCAESPARTIFIIRI